MLCSAWPAVLPNDSHRSDEYQVGTRERDYSRRVIKQEFFEGAVDTCMY